MRPRCAIRLALFSAVWLTQGLVYPQEKPNVSREISPQVSSSREWTEDLFRAVSLNAQLEEIYMRRQWQLIDFPTYDRLISETTSKRTEVYKKYQSRGPEVFKQFSDIVKSRSDTQIPALRTKFLREHGQPPAGGSTGVPSGHGPSLREIQQREGLHNTFWSLVIWSAIIFGLIVLFRGFLRAKKPGPAPQPALSDNYGTASFADPWTEIPNAQYPYRGVFFGKDSHPEFNGDWTKAPGVPFCSLPQGHTLVIAPTRSGKGTRTLIPTLLRYSGSMLIMDVKGELSAVSARARQHVLKDVPFLSLIVNPWGVLADEYRALGLTRATYNPLDILDRDDPNVVANAQTVAHTILPMPADAKDRFWQGNAANILTAVLLWITDQPGETKTLARAREITSLSRRDFTDQYMTRMAASGAFDGAIKELIGPFLDLANETYSGIMANLSEGMRFLSDPQLKAATAKSTFSMKDLIELPISIYIIIPPERLDTQRTWLRLIFAAATTTFKSSPMSARESKHRCMFLIDEFPALGAMPNIGRDLATMAGFGLDYTLAVQGLDQLKETYKDGAGPILTNCAWKWFCNVKDLDSAKYLSESLGKKTVQTISKSESSGANRGGATEGESTTAGETGRNLMNPDEILNLGTEVAIVLNPVEKPHYVRTVDYWNMAAAFNGYRDTLPALYWQPPLQFDPNPYIPDSIHS
jgi:type IV secretory pathway TraG/TraD family ATPase VirD4